MKNTIKIYLALIFLFPPALLHAKEDFAGKVVKPVKKSVDIRQATQKDEDMWEDERAKLALEYKNLEMEKQNLLALNQRLNKESAGHKTTIASYKKRINDIDEISAELLPYLTDVLKRLDGSVAKSLPFLSAERKSRLENIHKIFKNPKVTTAEKFRKAMEALQVEAEYGNNVEVYQESVKVGGSIMVANIFRLGRLSLFFQTLDAKTSGYYNPAESSWNFLPDKYNMEIGKAIDIANKRRSIDMLVLPLGKVVAR
jgi:hypothetical protein